MKRFRCLRSPAGLLLAGFPLIAGGCASKPPAAERERRAISFERVRPVLEGSCVHCHGWQRLPSMPPLTNTAALASLRGLGGLIIPGQPENSRFFNVVTLTDDQVGAMPPTGHALSRGEVEMLREWIREGALLPVKKTSLTPRGTMPRSR